MGEIRDTLRMNLEFLFKKSTLNKKQIAEKLGVSPSSLTNWTKGDNSPDIETIANICKIFNISIVDLFEYDLQNDKKITPSEIESEERLTAEKNIFDIFNTLDTEQLIKFNKILRIISLPDEQYRKIEKMIGLILDEE